MSSENTPTVWDTAKKFLRPLASLQLTVVLFAMAMVLVFFGTLAQMDNGIWTVVDQYFWSMIVWIPLDLIAKFCGVFFFDLPKDYHLPGSFPFPAGKLLGFAMLVNLLAAHTVRFKITWNRAGIFTIHAGLILLFIGEAITRTAQVEQRMTIDQWGVVNFAEDTKEYELAFEFQAADGSQMVTVVPQSRLVEGQRFRHSDVPVDVELVEYMPNSMPKDPENPTNPATTGVGLKMFAERKRPVSGTDTDQKVDMPSAYIRVYKKDTEELLGTHLVSVWQSSLKMPSDAIAANGKTYRMSLRNTRYYKPYSLQLLKFEFTRYTGTEKAKGFRSDIRLLDPERNVDRNHSISMNDPLRYAGEAFFQSSFDSATEATTILQVVRNPGWFIPYVSCVMVGVGMLVHFGMYLIAFLRKKRVLVPNAHVVAAPQPRGGIDRWLRIGVFAFVVLYLLSLTGRMFPKTEPFDLKTFSRIPVLDGGRWKPLDSFARVSYRMLAAREEVTYVDEWKAANPQWMTPKHPAIEWFLQLSASGDRGRAADAMCFKIDNDQLLALLKLTPRSGLLYSHNEFAAHEFAFEQAYEAVREKQKLKQPLDQYEGKVRQVGERVALYRRLVALDGPQVLEAPGQPGQWLSLYQYRKPIMDQVLLSFMARRGLDRKQLMQLPDAQKDELIEQMQTEVERATNENPTYQFWNTAFQFYRDNKPEEFNKLVRDYVANHPEVEPGMKAKIKLESWYNAFAPFYQCLMLYIIAAVLCIASWFGRTETLRRSAFDVLLLTICIHFVALIVRMYLQDRWLVFVTNLYSSAIFIGFGCVVLGLILERIYPIGIGNLCAAVLGTATTIVSHQIAGGNDTMEMLVAVLDTNFWLATHVTCVTFGYTATFVAGKLGIMYVVRGIFTRSITPEMNKSFNSMIYGVVAFATLLSFVGTVLGGIWADQSWGRFWGWDPKENGAVLIVIWNALILHARWAGLVKTRGMALLAIAGNMVTVWSWFGTNQLGIGLHAYGFDNTLALVCSGLWISHAMLIGLGMLPTEHWLSFMPKEDATHAEKKRK
jgi:ABC-type transport system involved in cytochrome c biogenesis permease subunit